MISKMRNHFIKRTDIVAAVLSHRGHIGLFQRSSLVKGDRGLWHCITGFLPKESAPLSQAMQEVKEETGISCGELLLQNYKIKDIKSCDGRQWRIHAFHFESLTDEVALDWEHAASSWVLPNEISAYSTVSWGGCV